MEWNTSSENCKHAWAMGLKVVTNNLIAHAKEIADNRSIKILQYDLQGNFIKEWKNAVEAEKELNINKGCIYHCCKRRHNTAGGYIWKYKEET